MSDPTTSAATGNAISSPGLAAGRMPSALPAGMTPDPFGPAPVRASHSARRESGRPALTNGISGLRGFGSSASVALTEFLANRLRPRLGSDGSTEYSQTWRMKVTPAGRRYWEHIASARRISGSDCSGWPTPTGSDGTGAGHAAQGGMNLRTQVMLAGWATPRANKWGEADSHGRTAFGSGASTERRGAL